MILNDDEIKERIESPMNLLNRLQTSLSRATNGSNIHSIIPPSHPSLPPKAEDIVPDLEDKIRNQTAKTKAMGVMVSAIDELKGRITEVQRPESLARIAHDMSRVIGAVDDRRVNTATVNSQIIVYAPQIQPIDNFEVIDVAE